MDAAKYIEQLNQYEREMDLLAERYPRTPTRHLIVSTDGNARSILAYTATRAARK